MAALSPFRAVARSPGLPTLFGAATLARLPLGVNTLALLLFVREHTGSFGTAGAVTGGFTLGNAIGAAVQGRLMDRFDRRRVLLPAAVAHAAWLGAVLLLVDVGAGAALLVAAATLAGATMPPISATLRSLLHAQLSARRDLLRSAYALDVVIVEVLFVLGPLVTALIVAAAAPEWALVLSMTLVVSGTVAFCRAGEPTSSFRARGSKRRLLGGLAVPGVQAAVLFMFPLGFCFGAVEVTLPAFAVAESRPAVGGVLIALLSVGSAIGGVVYASHRAGSAGRALLVLAAILPFGIAPLALMPASPVIAACLVLVAGAAMAPLIAIINEIVGDVADASAGTESYTWIFTAMTAGMTGGFAATGQLLDAASWRSGFALAAGGAACAALVAAARRRALGAAAVVSGC